MLFITTKRTYEQLDGFQVFSVNISLIKIIRKNKMKIKIKKLNNVIIFLSMMALAISTPVLAKGPLWKVTKGDDHLYIGGTVHVLGKDDYPLPPAFEKTYKDSQHLVLETDLQALQAPALQMELLTLMSYQDGTTLEDHIRPQTYAALEKSLSASGIPMLAVKNFKPSMIATMLTVVELKKMGIAGEGVDQFYTNKAIQDKKTLGKLETVAQQIAFLTSMGAEDPDEFILYTLRDIKQLPKMFKDLKAAWRKGDNNKLAELAIEPLKAFPDTYQTLIVKRNKAWVPQIEAMLRTKEIEMILVGALHLAGDESVLNKLKALGYEIEQL